MCGICGVIEPGVPGHLEVVREMCRVLAHRGPDDEGFAHGDGWALGHRRLSILDLSSAARQPMSNETGSCHLVYNGEVYNYQSLRDPLGARGHVFKSQSDTDVLLHSLEDRGARVLHAFNGMFAFAFLDVEKRELLLVRDRLGIKPLYYARLGKAFVFASEVKALFSYPYASPSLDRARVNEMLQYRYIAGEDTLLKDVHALLPGHLLRLNLDTLDYAVEPYWQPTAWRGGSDGDEYSILRRMRVSVRRRLVSDVPVGTQLSGGLDSSLVTALAREQKDEQLHTFSVGFQGSPEDESGWAQLVANRLDTIHHAVTYTEQEFLEDLAVGTYLHDDPINHPNSLPMYKLCREAKKHVTVLLTGEGADELFAGYSWHRRMWRLRRLRGLGSRPFIRDMAQEVLQKQRLHRAAAILGVPPDRAAAEAGKWVMDWELAGVLEPAQAEQGAAARAWFPVNTIDPLAAILDLDLRAYLVSVLQRQDRMSMAAGVESRVPFLDHELVQAALQIKVGRLFRRARGKAPVRRIAKGLVPDPVLKRAKVGFRVPIAEWMLNPNGLGALLGWLWDESGSSRGIWQPDRVRTLAEQHQRGIVDHSDLLWSLLAFEIWTRIYIDGTPHEQLKSQVLQTCSMGKR